jgi:hypothetical protein
VRTVSHDQLTTKLGTASTETRQAISKQIALLTCTPTDIAGPESLTSRDRLRFRVRVVDPFFRDGK